MSGTSPVGASSPAATDTQTSAPDAAAFEAAVAQQAGVMGATFLFSQSMQMMNNTKAEDDERQQS